MKNKTTIIKTLKDYNYFFTEHSHKQIYTVKESLNIVNDIPGAHTKNLFLKNKKNKFFLISSLHSTSIVLKDFSKNNNLGNLSFSSSNHLESIMNVKPAQSLHLDC